MKLQEAMSKSEKYDVDNIDDLKKLMKKLGKNDNKVRTVSVIFGMAYVKTWSSQSRISYNAVGDSPMQVRGYWQKGKLNPFSEKLVIKYQNTGMGKE